MPLSRPVLDRSSSGLVLEVGRRDAQEARHTRTVRACRAGLTADREGTIFRRFRGVCCGDSHSVTPHPKPLAHGIHGGQRQACSLRA